MKKLISLFLILCMVASLLPAAFAEAAVDLTAEEVLEEGETIIIEDGALYADGMYAFAFVVEDTAGNQISTIVISAQETVGAALTELNMIGGDESDWGLYVKTINGITADYDADQSYWAFYIDGEYAMTGVDATMIEDGSEFTFRLEGGSKTFADAEEPEEGDPIALEDGMIYMPESCRVFTFVVEDGENDPVTCVIITDKETVGEALVSLQIVAGEESDWGLYVKTVNGVTADYNVDGHYWAFYIDGEYAMTGVDATEIADGSVYTFRIE